MVLSRLRLKRSVAHLSKNCVIDIDSPKMDWVVDQLFTKPEETDANSPHSFNVWVGQKH